MLRVSYIATVLTMIAAQAQAHSIRVGDLEFVHPVIIVPRLGLDHSCAHAQIINHGNRVEYFRGVHLSLADNVKLLKYSKTGSTEISPIRLAILPRQALDLRSPFYRIFLSGLRVSLEADIGVYPGKLLFEWAGKIPADFMIDVPDDAQRRHSPLAMSAHHILGVEKV